MNKKLLAGICSTAIGLSCIGLSAFADSAPDLNEFEPTAENVKLIGRTYYNGEALWFGHSAAGVEFTFTGSTVSVTIRGDGAAIGKTDGARIGIFADGVRVKDVMLTTRKQTFSVELEEGEHTVSILKLSECANGTIFIDNISTDSESIAPTAAKAHKIEVIGDSITCGYGIDGANEKESFMTKTEDGSRTYAYKAAQLLDADYSMVCVSGSGVVSGYGGGSKPNTQNLMPDFYPNVGHSWGWTDDGTIDSVAWDFNSYVPDLIVINLGTNDHSYTKGQEEKIAEFVDAYIGFLKQVRASNPDSEILCSLGIMGQELFPAIEEAVAAYTAETGDTKVNTLMFDNQDGATDGLGSDWHPTEQTHEKAAYKLAARINELYGWDIYDVDITASPEKLVPTIEEAPPADSSSEDETSSEETSSEETASSETSESAADSSAADNSQASSASASTTSSKASSTSSTKDANPATGLAAAGAGLVVLGLSAALIVKKRK
ncbi:MAG: GDSL-type esterase/lipase family protein [Oscillospiraceae bacterium]